MVIAFKESDRAAIEAKGLTVVELKRIVYRIADTVSCAWKVIEDFVYRVEKELEVFIAELIEMFDIIRLAYEQTTDH